MQTFPRTHIIKDEIDKLYFIKKNSETCCFLKHGKTKTRKKIQYTYLTKDQIQNMEITQLKKTHKFKKWAEDLIIPSQRRKYMSGLLSQQDSTSYTGG